jgi:hypothetical protein
MQIQGLRLILCFPNNHSSMTTSFILRFQEAWVDAGDDFALVPVSMGTKTQTFVAAESSDPDPAAVSLAAIPVQAKIVAGTQTMTNVRAEAADADPGERGCSIFPR